MSESDGIGVAAVRPGAARYWVIAPGDKLAEHRLTGDMPAADRIEHDWRLADIRDGLPQIYSSTHEAFVAQMLNLDLLDGISFSKGCYTGQEIIARTQHLGRIKRRMYRLQLPEGEWRIGQSLHLGDGRSGRLVEVARSGERLRGPGGAQCAQPTRARMTPRAIESVARHVLPLPYCVCPALPDSGRMCGNSRTSRMDGELVYSMTSRSTPKPSPAAGGMPYSSART